MASEVDICNLALAHLGDTATVASIKPPEGSAQAEHCARFYPVARDTLLEMAYWNFAMRRVNLAQLTQSSTEWKYTYAIPSDCLNPVSVLPPDAQDDYAANFFPADNPAWMHNYSPVVAAGQYVPQKYSIETLANGSQILLTNQEDAVLRYSAYVTDTTQFSPLFVMTLSWHLASMLAGPVVKGDAGAAEAKRCAAMAKLWQAEAETSDANQRQVNVEHIVPWTSGR